MLNVQCPSCSAPYSLSEKRVPATGMKMRCPKCGSSFVVMQDGGVKSSEAAASTDLPSPRSLGAPAPPPKKKPLFSAPNPSELPTDDPFAADLDIGLPAALGGNFGALPDPGAADFGALDLGLDLGFQDDGGADLPAPARVDNLPAPAAQAPPRPPAPPPKPSAPPPVEDDDFDLPAPAHFDDLPAPAAGFADDLPATRDERTKKGPPRATPSLDDDFNAQFSADLDGMLAPPPVPPPPGAPRGEAAVDLTALDGALGADDAAPVKVKKKRNYIKVALIVLPTLAIAGGALTLTPAGPYGYYAITDRTNRADFEEQLTALRATARTNLANDTSVESEALANQARTHQEGQPRFAPIAHYTATIAFLHSLRFGKHGELNALGKTLLDGSSAQEAGPLRAVALAGRLAVEGKLDEALTQAVSAVEQNPSDLDALAMAGEIALAAKKVEVAQKQWNAAVLLEKSARTHYGLARAEFLAGNEAGAADQAERALKLSANHAGARTLIASTLSTKVSTEARAKTLLGEVLSKGPIRAGASTTEIVSAYNLLGYVQLGHSQLTAAEKSFGESLKLDPQSEAALIGNGELLYEAGRFTDALARFEGAKTSNPNSTLAVIGIAKVKLGQELFKEAHFDLKTLSETTPDPLVGYWLGRASDLLGRRDEAEKAYRKAITQGGATPGVVRAYVALAELLASRGKAEDGAKVLAEAATKLPNSFELHMANGDVALNASRLEAAKTAYQTALSLDEQNVAPMFKLGIVHRKAREYDDAKKRFEAVAAVDPNYPSLALEWGLLYSETGKTDQALKMYQDALQKAPDDIDLMLRVGSTQVLNGQSGEAIKHLDTVFNKRRSSPDVNYFLGRAYLQENDPTKALGYLRTAARADANRADYQLYFGWAAADANQQGEAEKAIEAALALDATLADAYWQRGVLLQRKGKVNEALIDLKLAVELSPLRFEAYAAMALCYGELTQQSEAEEAWTMALAGRDVPEWHYRLAKLLLNKNSKAEALGHFESAVDLATKALDDKKSTQAPPWLADANFQLGELARQKNKERALKAFLAYLHLATPDDAFRKDAQAAVRALGGRVN